MTATASSPLHDSHLRHPAGARLRSGDQRRLPVQASRRLCRRRRSTCAGRCGRHARCSPRGCSRSAWLIATGAWVFHVAAMSMAPLSIGAGRARRRRGAAGGHGRAAVRAARSPAGSGSALGLTAGGLMLLGFTLPACTARTRASRSRDDRVRGRPVLVGTLLIIGPRIGAPEQHHGFMLGAAAGILFGVSDVAIKALSGMIGAHGVRRACSVPWTAGRRRRVGRRLLRLGQGPAGRRGGPVIAVTARPRTSPGSSAGSSCSATRCRATRWRSGSSASRSARARRGVADARAGARRGRSPSPDRRSVRRLDRPGSRSS